MMSAEVLKYTIRIFERARLISTDSDDPLANRFVVEQRIELDHSMNIGERHAQSSGDLSCHGFRDPAIDFLGRMQGRQKPGTAQWNISFDCRDEECKVNFGHGLSESSID